MNDSELSGFILDVFPLVLRYMRAEVKAVEKRSGGLRFPQFRLMARLHRCACSNRQLAEWQGVSFPAMSRMLDGMVSEGWIRRRVNPEDRREVQLELTARGRQLYARVRKEIERRLTERIGRLSEHEKRLVVSGLEVLEGLLNGDVSGERS